MAPVLPANAEKDFYDILMPVVKKLLKGPYGISKQVDDYRNVDEGLGEEYLVRLEQTYGRYLPCPLERYSNTRMWLVIARKGLVSKPFGIFMERNPVDDDYVFGFFKGMIEGECKETPTDSLEATIVKFRKFIDNELR